MLRSWTSHASYGFHCPLISPRDPGAHGAGRVEAHPVLGQLADPAPRAVVEQVAEQHLVQRPGRVGEGEDGADGQEGARHLPGELLAGGHNGDALLPEAGGEFLERLVVGVVARGEVDRVGGDDAHDLGRGVLVDVAHVHPDQGGAPQQPVGLSSELLTSRKLG